MANLFKRTRLFIAAETGGFGVDPDATGAAYLPVRVFGDIALLTDGRVVLPTNYNTGRNSMTPSEVGNDGGSWTCEIPLLSFAAQATGAVPAADYQDTLFDCAFGANVSYSGTTVSSSTATTITVGAANATTQDLLAIRDAAVNSGYMQYRRVNGATSPYTVHRSWDANPSATAVMQGIRRWGPLSDPGGNTLTAYYDLDGSGYVATGTRVNSMKISQAAGQLAKCALGFKCDALATATARASLPAFSAWSGTPVKGQLWSVEWGGTAYPVKSVEIDFGLSGSDSESVAGTNGRANIENLTANPTVMITPLFASSWETDFRAGTARNLLIRFGSGALSGGATNSLGFWAENAQITACGLQNDGNRLRQSVKIEVRDPGVFTGTTAGRLWQLVRA